MRKLVKQFVFAVKTNLILNVDNRVGGTVANGDQVVVGLNPAGAA